MLSLFRFTSTKLYVLTSDTQKESEFLLKGLNYFVIDIFNFMFIITKFFSSATSVLHQTRTFWYSTIDVLYMLEVFRLKFQQLYQLLYIVVSFRTYGIFKMCPGVMN